MARATKDSIKKLFKTFRKMQPVLFDNKKDILFFPIEDIATTDFDGITIEQVNKDTGAKKELTPGLIVKADVDEHGNYGYNKVYLAYANIDYSPKFNLDQCASFMDIKHDKEDLVYLIECLLVKDEYIRAIFEL